MGKEKSPLKVSPKALMNRASPRLTRITSEVDFELGTDQARFSESVREVPTFDRAVRPSATVLGNLPGTSSSLPERGEQPQEQTLRSTCQRQEFNRFLCCLLNSLAAIKQREVLSGT